MYEVRLGWVGVFSGWGWSNLFSCRASPCVSPRGLKPALEWDSLASSGSFGAMWLPRREMAELILPSVCPATMNTGAIRDGVVLQPGRATKWDNALSSRFYYHLHTTHMQVCTCAQIRQAQTNKIQWDALHVGPYRHTHTHMSRCMNWSSLTYITLWPPSLSIILHPCRQPRLFAISAAAASYILLDRRRQKQWEES